MAGFEGFEKRLELHFTADDLSIGKMGLRRLDYFSIEKVLHEVQCTVVSALANKYFDSYVLSESSLFVYPTKIIIKTCGTTQLLKSVRPFVDLGTSLGLTLCGCRYTRGSFIFPQEQPFPHTSFKEEVVYLEECLPKNLWCKKAGVMNSKSCYKWHVFTASDEGHMIVMEDMHGDDLYTVEICMTELDRALAKKFFRRFNDGKTGDSVGKEMTEITGIHNVNEKAIICDYAFDPCGYSMNGIDGPRYSTVHVTPEDGFSYASFECVGSIYDDKHEFFETLRKVIEIFRPAALSVSMTSPIGCDVWKGVAKAIKPLGMKLRTCAVDEFPAAGNVAFQTFTSSQKIIKRSNYQ